MTPPPTGSDAMGFTFADSADAELYWQHDKIRFPDPLAPMEAAMLERALGRGFTHVAAAYNAPIERVEVRSISGYQYQSIVMATGTREEMAARGALAEQTIRAAIGRLDELWGEKILPEVREHLGFWDSFDLAAASRRALTAHVAQSWEHLVRVWELHFETVLPVHVAISEFDEHYRGLFPDAGPLDSSRLLQGLPTMTLEVGQELWRLSRRAIERPAVRAIIETCAAWQIPAVLRVTTAGREFLADLDAYVDRYPRRADRWTLLAPSWTEDPTPVIECLRDLVRRPEADAPAVVAEAAAVARDRAIVAARERLASHPAAAERFEALLTAAQVGTAIGEDRSFWIDNMTTHHLRAVLLEAGRWLVDDGALIRDGDVFLLDPEELQRALAKPRADLRRTVAERAHVMQQQATMTAPPVLGRIAAAPSPADDPCARLAARFCATPSMEHLPEGEIRGCSGSAAVARGTIGIIPTI